MIQLIVNPVAGNGRAKAIGEQAVAYLIQKGVKHAVVYTERAGHATELAKKAACDGADTVVAVGGDGTVSETAAGLMHTGCALGIVSAGTGNDFVKSLNLPRKWQDALELILTCPAKAIDTGIMNDTFFINISGAGFDVMVLDYALQAKRYVRGMLPYLYGVIRAVKNYKPFAMHIEMDAGQVLDGEYMICSIANGQFFGGGIPIAPMADVADGKFDVIIVDAVPRWKIPFYLPGLLTGKIMKYRIANHYKTTRCVLSAKGMRLNLDGEILSVEHTAFSCQRDALRVHW